MEEFALKNSEYDQWDNHTSSQIIIGSKKSQTGPTKSLSHDPLRLYLRELKNYNLLSREEEIELAQR